MHSVNKFLEKNLTYLHYLLLISINLSNLKLSKKVYYMLFILGEGSFKQKSILDQAEEFIECSKQNIHYFKPPSVIFSFANGVEECVIRDLNIIGVQVENWEENKNSICKTTVLE